MLTPCKHKGRTFAKGFFVGQAIARCLFLIHYSMICDICISLNVYILSSRRYFAGTDSGYQDNNKSKASLDQSKDSIFRDFKFSFSEPPRPNLFEAKNKVGLEISPDFEQQKCGVTFEAETEAQVKVACTSKFIVGGRLDGLTFKLHCLLVLHYKYLNMIVGSSETLPITQVVECIGKSLHN